MALSTRSGSRWVCYGLGCCSMCPMHGPLHSLLVMPVQIPGIYKIRHIGQTTITTGAVSHLMRMHLRGLGTEACIHSSGLFVLVATNQQGTDTTPYERDGCSASRMYKFCPPHADLWDVPSSRCSAALRAMMVTHHQLTLCARGRPHGLDKGWRLATGEGILCVNWLLRLGALQSLRGVEHHGDCEMLALLCRYHCSS